MPDPFISYAQNFEDVVLWRALQGRSNGFYIDVGAYSPVVDSVTKAFYDRGWRGLNIDPDPAAYESFVRERVRDVNLMAAISDRVGEQTMYFVRDTGLSTLDVREAQARRDEGRMVTPQTVAVTTLNAVWAEHVPAHQLVHFLKVDVEGSEFDVLAGNDWATNRPWVVVVESTRPNSPEPTYDAWEHILLDNHYVFAYGDGLNRFYVASEQRELAPTLAVPPNPFDNYLRATEVDAQDRAERAEAELASLRASFSWRITKPLRLASRSVRRVARQIRQPRG